MKYDHVLFDLDGTLMNTSKGVIKSVKYTLNYLNLQEASDDVLKKFIGPPIEKSFEQIIGMSKSESVAAAAIFRKIYPDLYLFEAEFYDGIESLISDMKESGIITSIATYKRESYTVKLLKHFKIYDKINYVIGSDENGKMTKTDIINKCINLSQIDKSKSVMIGDTKHDASSANDIGTNFIAVTYGFGFKSKIDLAGFNCDAVCNNAQELRESIFT